MGMVGGIMWAIVIGGGGIPAGGIMCGLPIGGGMPIGPGAAGSGISSGGPTPNCFTGIPIDLSLLVKLKEKIGTRWRRAQPSEFVLGSFVTEKIMPET